MFCLSFVIVTVRARLAGLSDTLEQAAADLYATPQQAFWKVTFPLVFPGILGAALLGFSLSFDDFIITNLNAGTTTTFPMYVWGVSRRDPDADQRRRHGDVDHLGGDRGRRRGPQPAPDARARRSGRPSRSTPTRSWPPPAPARPPAPSTPSDEAVVELFEPTRRLSETALPVGRPRASVGPPGSWTSPAGHSTSPEGQLNG